MRPIAGRFYGDSGCSTSISKRPETSINVRLVRLAVFSTSAPRPCRTGKLRKVMGAAVQLIPLIAFLVAIALAGELAWHYLRWRRLRQGTDIGMMPFSLGRYWGLGAKGAGAGIALALFAAAIAVGLANPTLGGYIFIGVGIAAFVVLMTAYYVWRARSISRRWWRRAEAENDPERNRQR